MKSAKTTQQVTVNAVTAEMPSHFSSRPFHTTQDEQEENKKENKTGLPNRLKTGIENLSGISLDEVKVHYNSDKPSQLQAHAYAQGSDIHLGSGQEKHLPHEAWHVVQQKQGRVKPTLQMKGGVKVNDDQGLEREADVMGAKALNQKHGDGQKNKKSKTGKFSIQRKTKRKGDDQRERSMQQREKDQQAKSKNKVTNKIIQQKSDEKTKPSSYNSENQVHRQVDDYLQRTYPHIAFGQEKYPTGESWSVVQPIVFNPQETVAQRKLFSSLSDAGIVQRCISPSDIGKGKEPGDRLSEFITYAEKMMEKAEDKGFEAIEKELQSEAEQWYGEIYEKFSKIIEFVRQIQGLKKDEEITSGLEILQDYLQEANEAYQDLKKADSSKKNLPSGHKEKGEEKEEDKDVGTLESIVNDLPDRSQFPKIKGRQELSKVNKTKIANICESMKALKGRLMVSDNNATLDWMGFFNNLLEYLKNLSREDPEQYVALISLGVIREIKEMTTMFDRGEMCNEELPNNILKHIQ
jgi:hypothetical protein